MRRRCGRRGHRQGESIAVLHAWRHDESHRMAAERLTAAIAGSAPVGPHFAAAPACDAELAHGHIERNRDARKRFPWREMKLRGQPARAIAFRRRRDKARAHPFNRAVQRRKVDRNFVVEPSVPARERHREHTFRGAAVVTRANGIVPHRLRYDRVATPPCQGEQRGVSIRALTWNSGNVPSAASACVCARASRPIVSPERVR